MMTLLTEYVTIIASKRRGGNYGKSACGICGRNGTRKARDGMVCEDCYKEAGFPASISISLMPVSLIEEQIESADGLSITKRFAAKGGEAPKSKLEPQSDKTVRCPKCGSTQLNADKKGFGVGKAVIGAALLGGIGLAAGNIGSGKVRITCLNCGNQWMAGQA